MILHLAIPVPLYSGFDYLPPDDLSDEDLQQLKPGIRLKAPWRNDIVIGVLLSVHSSSHISLEKLKKAFSILDQQPLFSDAVLALIKFASEYYHHPIGEVYSTALPLLLQQGKDTEYCHNEIEFEELPEVAPVLSAAQRDAVENITQKLGQFAPFLLFGVTGSGKTEVYLQILEQILHQKKQALILVPEIGLTPQIVSRFQKRFPIAISVLHSRLTPRQRQAAWLRALNGDVSIVIGTRSAIFTPLKNPGIIIIDEEHDLSFKQQEGLRYSARDLALRRAQLENILVILGSATPSLESLHNVKLQRYELLSLPERAGIAVHPIFHLVDLRTQKIVHGLSGIVIASIRQHLAQKAQVLIFLNRRGFAPALMCHQCGWIVDCKRCSAKMTLHQTPLHLQCHHCAASRPVDKACLDCGELRLYPLGAGTERLEEALSNHFPDCPLIRLDKDTTRTKGSFEKKLSEIHTGESCILIGTQMLAKGHHFPNVNLSVIINIDGGFFSTDFRGIEKTAQIIVQVAGRSGRVEKQGEVILQTYHPEHALLKTLIQNGYQAFAELALQERAQAGLPPYQFLVLIRAEALTTKSALLFLSEVKKLLAHQSISVLGPIDSPLQRKADRHRAQLLLQSTSRKNLKTALNFLIAHTARLKYKQQVRWSIDVDPLEML